MFFILEGSAWNDVKSWLILTVESLTNKAEIGIHAFTWHEANVKFHI